MRLDLKTLQAVRAEVDGMKEVDKETLVEKPHEESCCNETLDDLLTYLDIEIAKAKNHD